MANDIKLQEGHPIDENLRPLKVGGESSALEIAKQGNGARVSGNLTVDDDITCDDITCRTLSVTHDGVGAVNISGTAPIILGTDIEIVDYGEFEIDATGDIILDADGGNISLLDGGSTYTPTASSDAVPLSHLPFVLYSQFADDLATSKHYLPLKGYFEQSLVGQEPAGMIAPFNMKLQKIAMRCSEDISGGTWKIGMFAVDSGTTHNHHHTNGLNWITATGGVADTNATFDFTGTVGLAASGSGGSNAVTAGQWIDFQIFSDTDVTSSSAEFWITLFFIADLASTI